MTRVRHDVSTITLGDAAAAETEEWHPVLDAYAHGVALMRGLDADVSPDSWIWAANTHGIPRGTRPRPSWGQCAHASRFFLPWHRAYLAWFESTVRRLTGQDDWALPYWDYSDPGRPEIDPDDALRDAIDVSPAGGDLLVMGGRCQREWLHAVPTLVTPVGSRISAQWRWTSRRGEPDTDPTSRDPRYFSRP